MMKKRILPLTIVVLGATTLFFACQSGSSSGADLIASDSITIASGKKIFDKNCSSCHSIRLESIGPALAGVTKTESVEWLRNFIKDPAGVIKSGDKRAETLLDKYHAVMPSFTSLSDTGINAVIAYLHQHRDAEIIVDKGDSTYLRDPIKDSITLSSLVVSIQEVAQIPHSSDEAPFARIAKMDVKPNTNDIFINDQRGKMYAIQQGKPVVYFDMVKERPAFIPQPGLATGFGSFAFHPDFAKNGLFYTTHTELPSAKKPDFGYADSIKSTVQWVLTEWKTDNPGQVPFSGKPRELFRVNMVTGIHGVQEITFNPLSKPGSKDYGLLYIGVGDGGSVEQGFGFLAHSPSRIWGTILRIDPKGKNSANGAYGIPPANPFSKSSDPTVVKEIYAYGFRNPNRITWSRAGQLMASNIGQGNIEALNLILPGHDYGWPIREGTFALHKGEDMKKVFDLPADDSAYHITYPVIEYDHTEGNAFSGGFEYWGSEVPALKGKYLFGDIANGRLFYAEMADLKLGSQAPIKEWRIAVNGKPARVAELFGNGRVDLRLGRDGKGELYLFMKTDGKVYKIISEIKS